MRRLFSLLNQMLGDIKQAEIWYLKPCDPAAAATGPALGSALSASGKSGEAERMRFASFGRESPEAAEARDIMEKAERVYDSKLTSGASFQK
jgi:hypothetical protein